MRKIGLKLQKLAVCLLFLAVVALVAFLLTGGGASPTLAWFVQESKSNPLEFHSGKLLYTLEYAPMEEEGAPVKKMIVPGQNLLDHILLQNHSSIETDLRVKITYTDYETVDEKTPLSRVYGCGTPLSPEKLYGNLTPIDAKTKQGFYWDGALYWQWDSIPAVADAQAGAPVPLFQSPMQFYYDGRYAGNEFNGKYDETSNVYLPKPVTVTLHFEMKQAENVDWEEAFSLTI